MNMSDVEYLTVPQAAATAQVDRRNSAEGQT
jgi:hypothetical protein